MPFPQVQTGLLTPSLTPVAVGASNAYTLTAGSLTTATPTGAATATLPAVSLGAVVVVENRAAFTITVSSAEGAGTTIAGAATYVLPAGGTGASQTQAVFVSDGTLWHVASR